MSSSRYDNKSFTPAKAEARASQRRRVHGGSSAQPPMAFDVGYAAAPPAARVRTWRSTVVGIAIGFGIVLAFAMKWLMSYQIDSAQERHEQQKAMRAAAARCYELASNAAINACLKDVEARGREAQ
ncbi:hypothetical protein EJP69_07225 [Variovorax gossypii]|uniref:Uncharacterized protein n=1 Tax=Variovorax gossypii TaxID=1679495 RepID=A0A431TTN5_9BURK|nr:hypothetical protein [Variovorax gossypii]RTQ37509.1 hypothetical protein EJP69_07225 [Variovorax gossypii]